MRLVIIGVDNTVGKDGVFREGLNLSECGLPENFWALQWNEHNNESGHIEYTFPSIQNDEITELPTWALECVKVYQTKLDQETAEAAQLAAHREA